MSKFLISNNLISFNKENSLKRISGIVTALKEGKLWRGYGLCAARAIVVNSVGFKAYDYCKSFK